MHPHSASDSPRNFKKGPKSQKNNAKSPYQKKTSDRTQAEEKVSGSLIKEAAEKATSSLNNLGSQTFAFSPFTAYYDDWLTNVRNVISHFESNPEVNVDVEFTEAYKQIIADLERELSEKKLREASLLEVSNVLSETNHTLAQLESEYSAKTHALNLKKSNALEGLSLNVSVLKEELVYLEKMKTSFFNPLSKKIKAQKIAEATEKLEYAESELGMAIQNFKSEQEKLHNQYIKEKQLTLERSQDLRKEVEKMEIDSSIEARRNGCNALSDAINALIQRKRVSAS